MSKEQIRVAYREEFSIGYEQAIMMLGRLGFTEYAADRYLFAVG
jgi:hypothetical protein